MTQPVRTVPTLAVVIIGLNEADWIEDCIRSVRRMVAEIPETEIVYVDSGSVDGTIQMVLDLGVRVFQLGRAQPPSPAAGRFVGSRVTNSKYIIFVDGDSVVAEGWVQHGLSLMEQDPTIVICAGRLLPDGQIEGRQLPNVEGLGKIQPVHTIGGGRAPIIARKALTAAGNWNPFVRYCEEEDLAIRMRHFVSGARVMFGDTNTVLSRIVSLSPVELVRRWKRGFVVGPGQILRNSIAHGYLRHTLHFAKPIILLLVFVLGLVASIFLKVWWQFLLIFFGLVVFRAIVTRKLIRVFAVFYSFLSGFYSFKEFVTTSPRTSDDYVCDYVEILREGEEQQLGRETERCQGNDVL